MITGEKKHNKRKRLVIDTTMKATWNRDNIIMLVQIMEEHNYKDKRLTEKNYNILKKEMADYTLQQIKNKVRYLRMQKCREYNIALKETQSRGGIPRKIVQKELSKNKTFVRFNNLIIKIHKFQIRVTGEVEIE